MCKKAQNISSISAAAKPKSNSHARVTMYGKQVSSCTANTVILEENSESKDQKDLQAKSFGISKIFIKKTEGTITLETHF